MMSSRVRPFWEPTDAWREQAAITRFARWLESTRGLRLPEYDDLWRWSVTDIEGFWAAVWEYFDVQASVPYQRVLGKRDMPGAEWFPGARLNYARHIFRDRDAGDVAIQHASESHDLDVWTWGDLRAHTAELAGGGTRSTTSSAATRWPTLPPWTTSSRFAPGAE
jgi:acetoacetyl-CoA synthetase